MQIHSKLIVIATGALLISGAGCATGGGGGGDGAGRPNVNQNGNADVNVDDGAEGEADDGSGDVVVDDSGGGFDDGGEDGAPDGGQDDSQADADDGDDSGNDGTLGGSGVVKTRIDVGLSGKIDVGDDLIVYGVDPSWADSDQPGGVHFIIPSKSDNQTASGTMIPGSDRLFRADDFKVAERKVALVRSTYAVSIYDTQTGRLVDIPPTEISLFSGQMTSDGPFIATINNTDGSFGGTAVADGNPIKVIDVSGDTPVILSFPTPDDFDPQAWWYQTAVDAESRRVIALGGDNCYLYSLDKPDAQPTKFDFGFQAGNGRISGAVQIRLDGDYLLYHDDEGFDPVVSLLNLTDGAIKHFNDNPAGYESPLAMAGGSFGYFLFREDADNESGSFKTNVYRSAIGRTGDAPSATLASQLDHYDFRPTDVDEPGADQELCLREKKLVGYGATQCITPDGERWFLAGWSTVDDRFDHIQVSRGGAFSDIADPERTTYTGSLMGTDIVCSADTVAFRGLREVDDVIACGTTRYQVIAFIRLDKFEQ